RRAGAAGGLPGGDGSASRVSTQDRGDALGAVQGRRATESLCRDVQHSVLGGAHAPASWRPLDGDGQRDRGSRPRVFGPASTGASPASTVGADRLLSWEGRVRRRRIGGSPPASLSNLLSLSL